MWCNLGTLNKEESSFGFVFRILYARDEHIRDKWVHLRGENNNNNARQKKPPSLITIRFQGSLYYQPKRCIVIRLQEKSLNKMGNSMTPAFRNREFSRIFLKMFLLRQGGRDEGQNVAQFHHGAEGGA